MRRYQGPPRQQGPPRNAPPSIPAPNQQQQHTILLIQFERNPKSRTYFDYGNSKEALDGLCKMYEGFLKRRFPRRRDITYKVTELFEWVDTLPEINFFRYNDRKKAYDAFGRKWIKDQVFAQLKQQLQQK